MNKITIIADAACDLTEDFQAQYNIVVLPTHIVLPDQTEELSTFHWEQFKSREEFYADLKQNPDGYKTSPPNVYEFQQAIEQYAGAGNDVIVMTISGGISGAFGFATAAKEAAQPKYPQVKIACVDTRRFGPGFGLLVLYAAKLRGEGKSFDEIISAVDSNKNCFHQAGWLDDLSFVAKKGRMTHPKAFFGTLAGVKPIGEFDSNGLTTVIGKVKGAKNAYKLLLHYIEQTVINPGEQTFFIAQTNRLPQAEEFKKLIEETFHPKEIFIKDVFPPCGVNIGPGLMAAYYMGTPISADLSVEKKIVSDFCGEK